MGLILLVFCIYTSFKGQTNQSCLKINDSIIVSSTSFYKLQVSLKTKTLNLFQLYSSLVIYEGTQIHMGSRTDNLTNRQYEAFT